MPTLTGFVPITPGGTIQAYRLTQPHGMYFGHTQSWPNDVIHHSRHSAPYTPPQTPMAPWIPTADGYAEPYSTPKTSFDESQGRGASLDMRSEYNLNIDQTQDIEQSHLTTYNESVDRSLDQSMNSTIHRNDQYINQNDVDNSTSRNLDLSTQQNTENSQTVTQVTNTENVANSETNIDNQQDNSRTFNNPETHPDQQCVRKHGRPKRRCPRQNINENKTTEQTEVDNTSVNYVSNQNLTQENDNSVIRNEDHSTSSSQVSETNFNQVDNSVNEQVDNSSTTVVNEHRSELAYNDTRVVENDNSRSEQNSTSFNFVDQDNSVENFVDNNSTVINDESNLSFAYNISSENNFDQSRNVDQSTVFNYVDQNNARTNLYGRQRHQRAGSQQRHHGLSRKPLHRERQLHQDQPDQQLRDPGPGQLRDQQR